MQIAAPSRTQALSTEPLQRSPHGGWIEVIVLGAFAAELALLIGYRGSIAGILLATLAAAFWWYGYGRGAHTADPIAIGNAAGIMIGLAIGYPLLSVPALFAIPAVLIAGSRRMWKTGQRREFAYLVLTLLIATAGSAWLALNLHLLPR
jgi:hypothetical protein